MHPAFSVVFFTTASGAGFGLLALLGVFAVSGALPADPGLGVVGLGLAFGLASAGLLSSTAHLGRPERAWRAFSQWRSSWLSREGVAAVATYLPAGLFAAGWVFLGQVQGWVGAMGIAAALLSVVTVAMTGMIYASLKPVAEWHSPYTVPGYLIYSGMTGATFLNAILQPFGLSSTALVIGTAAAVVAGWGWKRATWRRDAGLASSTTANTATGLAGGVVRSVEWPHTERNYLLKEMGFRIARKHSLKLRRIMQILAFGVPFLCLVSTPLVPGTLAIAFGVVAVAAQFAGMLVERWLFFAEATHTVTLYYGR